MDQVPIVTLVGGAAGNPYIDLIKLLLPINARNEKGRAKIIKASPISSHTITDVFNIRAMLQLSTHDPPSYSYIRTRCHTRNKHNTDRRR